MTPDVPFRHGCWLLAAVLVGSLAGCESAPMRHGAGPPLTQKTMLRALDAVNANDEQRARVLGSYEAMRPKAEELRDEAVSLRERIHDLEPRSAQYVAQADKLATQLGELTKQQSRVQSHFVHEVATTLTARQWDQWLAFFRAPLETDFGARREGR